MGWDGLVSSAQHHNIKIFDYRWSGVLSLSFYIGYWV